MSKNKRKKGPQILTVALLVAYPVLCGQAATSFALSQQQSQGLLKTPLQTPLQHQTKNYQYLGPQSAYQSPAFFAKYSQTEEEYQSQVNIATQKLSSAKASLASATQKLNLATSKKATTQSALTTAQTALNQAQAALTQADSKVLAAQATLTAAQAVVTDSDAALTQQTQTALAAQATLNIAQANLTAATSNLTQAQATLTAAQTSSQSANQTANQAAELVQDAYQAYQAALLTVNAKLDILSLAQQNYNNSSILNPLYSPPSYQVQPTTYQVPDTNFQTGAPWTGDGSGQNGAPEIHPGHIHFSYVATEVYQDILISPRTIANYTYTASVWNQDQNSVNQGAIADEYGLGIIFYDANNNVIHQDSFLSTEVHSWRDVTLQGTNLNPDTPVAKVRIIVTGQDKGFWSGTYGPAMMNVRLQLGWIVGSTQASTTTATIPVDIGEGGETTFVAPNSGVFISSNLRYESYNDPSCGANVTPQGLGINTIQLVAHNSIYGDPCGGQQKHLVGTLTYSAAQPQFIKDPNLLDDITAAQDEYDNALTDLDEASALYLYSQNLNAEASDDNSTSQQVLEQAQLDVASATAVKDTAQTSYESAQSRLEAANVSKDAAASQNTKDKSSVEVATVALSTVTEEKNSLSAQISSLTSSVSSATTLLTQASSDEQQAQREVTSTQASVVTAQAELDAIPEYIPEEPKEPEVIKLPPLEDLTKVNLEEIVATDLTSAQAEQLKEAALETFETAAEGSPAYTAALEALFVAAQQNDITVDPALAEIPGVGAAAVALADAINFLGNAGADMSPATREESEKVVVAAVVAGNAAIAAAAGAASSAASAAASSSSSPQRKQ